MIVIFNQIIKSNQYTIQFLQNRTITMFVTKSLYLLKNNELLISRYFVKIYFCKFIDFIGFYKK